MEEKIQFRRNFIWNTLGTGLNAFNSLFFMIIATRINGVDKAGIFTIAFSTACILYAVGLYAGRVFHVTELNKSISDKDFIVNRLLTTLIMIVCLIVFCIVRKYNFEKSIIFLLLTIYKALEAFSDVIYGVLQKKENLDIVGKSLFYKSIVSVLLFLVVDWITKDLILSLICMIVFCVLIIIFYDFKKANKYINYKIKLNINNVFIILKTGFFTFAISFLGMYILNAPKYAIDIYLSDDFQTVFGIIVMPATIVGLVAQFLIHPYLTQILELYESSKIKELKKLLLKLISVVVSFGIFASVLGYLIGTQVLGIIYGLDLSEYKIKLMIIILSATCYTIVAIYSSVLTTVRQTLSQFIIYVTIAVITCILSNILTKHWKIDGAVIAYLFTMLFCAIIYTIYTNLKLNSILKRKKNEEKNYE
ncbi:MAG: hypothetical protein IKF52_03155 [Clostridia bacterium]|nr:hypothetical protein [Clostridia bacterium]